VVNVVAANGTGTMTVSPTQVINSDTGLVFHFVYTRAAGLIGGEIDIAVPAGWTAPDPSGFNAGATAPGCGDNPVTITGAALGDPPDERHPGRRRHLRHALRDGRRLRHRHRAVHLGDLHLYDHGEILLDRPPDGAGELTAGPGRDRRHRDDGGLAFEHDRVLEREHADFTYTAAAAISGGQINVVVPAGWSAPSTSSGTAGYSTSACGTLGTSGQTIQITAVN